MVDERMAAALASLWNRHEAVFLAVLMWLTPSGRQIWHQGITPDVEVSLPPDGQLLLPESEGELTAADLARSSDTQLLKAVEVLKGQVR